MFCGGARARAQAKDKTTATKATSSTKQTAHTVKRDRAGVKGLDADAVGRDDGRQVGGGVAEHRARPVRVAVDARVVRLTADRRRVEDELRGCRVGAGVAKNTAKLLLTLYYYTIIL